MKLKSKINYKLLIFLAPTEIVRLWCHETHRVYMDKLADGKDIENFEKIQKDVIKKSFDDGSVHEIKQRFLNLQILISSS